MYVLHELWRGNISPSERYVRSDSEYKMVSKEMVELIDDFIKQLSPEAKKQWDSIEQLRHDMTLLSEEDTFIYGFQLGARMLLDVVQSYKRQFYTMEESQ